jgi:hypothetical protein
VLEGVRDREGGAGARARERGEVGEEKVGGGEVGVTKEREGVGESGRRSAITQC